MIFGVLTLFFIDGLILLFVASVQQLGLAYASFLFMSLVVCA
jgi:hypothetical protein